MRVIVIEDNETTLMLLRRLVGRAEDVDAVGFSNPLDAMHELPRISVDLVLVDYTMPGMNGVEVILAIRAMSNHWSVPIVMVTGEHERAVRMEAFEAGVTDFLSKPIDPIEFKARVRNLLALRRAELAMRGLAA